MSHSPTATAAPSPGHRSPSSNVNSLMLENQDLIERNQNLTLKLRYVQSVNTIFRQRVGMLMQGLTSKLVEIQTAAPALDVNLGALFNAVNDSAVAEMPRINPEVAYWQDRFIDAMSNIQPISQHEVETLCRLIREKVDRDAIVTNPGGAGAGASSQHGGGGGGAGSPNGNSNSNSSSYADAVAAEVTAVREQLRASEARCKSLHHRITEMRKREESQQSQQSGQNLSLIDQVTSLSGSVRELRARLAEQESLNRRLTAEVNVLRSDKNLQMQHLSRMQGMCAAVMRESQCAVNEGLAATQMNETALLKRQMDTFELVLRKTENDLATARRHLEDKDQQLAEREREVHSLQLRMDSKEKTLELYRARCEALATVEKDQREEQFRSMKSMSSRVTDAVTELEGAYTTKDIASGISTLQGETEKFHAFRSALDDMQKQYEALGRNYAALSEELTLCAKQNRVPRTERLTAEMARALVGEVKFPREAVLRTEGKWREVRDLNEGTVFYVTSEIASTPFKPDSAPQAGGGAAASSPLAASSSPGAASLSPPSSPAATSLDAPAAATAAETPTTGNVGGDGNGGGGGGGDAGGDPAAGSSNDNNNNTGNTVNKDNDNSTPTQSPDQQQRQSAEDNAAAVQPAANDAGGGGGGAAAVQPAANDAGGGGGGAGAAEAAPASESSAAKDDDAAAAKNDPAGDGDDRAGCHHKDDDNNTTTNNNDSPADAAAGGGADASGPAAAAPAAGPLPPGWKEVVDKGSGRTYFVNKLTKQTQWVRPTEPAVGPDGKPATE